jgi:hypothetical protein
MMQFAVALHAKYDKPAAATRNVAQIPGGARLAVTTEPWRDPARNEMTVSNHANATHGF